MHVTAMRHHNYIQYDSDYEMSVLVVWSQDERKSTAVISITWALDNTEFIKHYVKYESLEHI